MKQQQPLRHHAVPVVRSEWWNVFWASTSWIVMMLAAILIWPDYAALWALLLIAGGVTIGMGYKSWKDGRPL